MTSIGVVTLLGARRGRDRVLGSLPLVLGLHQLMEAVVWLDVQGRVSAGVGRAAIDLWSVIAFVVLRRWFRRVCWSRRGRRGTGA